MKSKIFITTGIILCLAGSVLAAAGLEPGSSNDPLVTKSYVDSIFEDIKEYIENDKQNEKNNEENESNNVNQNTQNVSNSYVIKEFSENTKILCHANCEVILRSGKAKINSFVAADGTENGIQDITDGIDLKEGAEMPINHLLLVPRTDTRGFTTSTPVFVMIRGDYDIVK